MQPVLTEQSIFPFNILLFLFKKPGKWFVSSCYEKMGLNVMNNRYEISPEIGSWHALWTCRQQLAVKSYRAGNFYCFPTNVSVLCITGYVLNCVLRLTVKWCSPLDFKTRWFSSLERIYYGYLIKWNSFSILSQILYYHMVFIFWHKSPSKVSPSFWLTSVYWNL